MPGAGRCWIAAAVAATTLVCAAPASAWWAEGGSYRSGSFGAVNVYAEPGEVNDMTAVETQLVGVLGVGGVEIHDASAPVTPPPAGSGAGCTQLDAHTLRCTGIGFMGSGEMSVDYLRLDLGDGDDRIRIPLTSQAMWLWGSVGSGDDEVIKRDTEGASLDLGDGNDRIVLRGSFAGSLIPDAPIWGGAGDDTIDVLNGADDDNPACGDGHDILRADQGEDSPDCEVRRGPLDP